VDGRPGMPESRPPARPRDEHVDFCPSAQPEMEGALVFGVIGGTPEHPLVGYLDQPQDATPDLLALAEPVEPTEVFRFAAPCAESGCQHFDGGSCQLGRKLVQQLPLGVQRLPRCRLRPSCRWWREQGPAACQRCPLVVTKDFRAGPPLRAAADPSVAAGESSPS